MTVNVVIPGLTIVKTANTSTAVPGSVVGYTVTITDSGQTAYTGAVVTDDLTGVVDDAVYNGDAPATGGAVSYAGPGPDLDREPVAGGLGHGHLLRHREQPRHRRQAPHQHRRLVRRRVDVPAGHDQRPVPGHRRGADPGADDRQDRQRRPPRSPGQTVTLHDHDDRLRADPLHRGDASPTRWPGCSTTPPTTATPPPPPAAVSYASPDLTWTGSLAPGGPATITFSATVEQPRHRRRDPDQHRHLAHRPAATARPAAPTPTARPPSRCRS